MHSTHREAQQTKAIHFRRRCLCFPLTLWLSINTQGVGWHSGEAVSSSRGCPTHPPSVRAAQPFLFFLCCAHHPRAGVWSLGHAAHHSYLKTVIKIKQSQITNTSRVVLSLTLNFLTRMHSKHTGEECTNCISNGLSPRICNY